MRETIALALSLPTWRKLTAEEQLSDDDCVALFTQIVDSLVEESSP